MCSIFGDCEKEVASCLLETQYMLFKVNAYIVRRQQLNSGNFFEENIVSERSYIPITMSFNRLRDDGTKDDDDQNQITEDLNVIYRGSERIKRTDMILYDGSYYDVRDLFTQEWDSNHNWLYQKMVLSFIQIANDLPSNLPPTQ